MENEKKPPWWKGTPSWGLSLCSALLSAARLILELLRR